MARIYEVTIARDISEYATVRVRAESAEAAQAEVERIFVEGGKVCSEEHCDLVNELSWETGGETDEERVIDVEEDEDQEDDDDDEVHLIAPAGKTLTCDMEKGCTAPVTHVDEKGWVYCRKHGIERKTNTSTRCRQLTARERRQLEAGGTIRYERSR